MDILSKAVYLFNSVKYLKDFLNLFKLKCFKFVLKKVVEVGALLSRWLKATRSRIKIDGNPKRDDSQEECERVSACRMSWFLSLQLFGGVMKTMTFDMYC